MDRSFLSKPAVIAASRDFVCVRLATYEDPLEAKFTQSLVRTGSGELENTAFCLLGPDGKQRLSRSGRGLNQYADAAAFAAELKGVSAKFSPKAALSSLPQVADPRLALDIASADGLPLLVIVGKEEAVRRTIAERLAKEAWTDEFIGRIVYANGTAKDVVGVAGITIDTGCVMIAPDKYGQKGTVLWQLGSDAKMQQYTEAIRATLKEYNAPAKSSTHMREGQRLGVFWETKVPVTDPMENAARERGKKQLKPKE